MGTSALVARLPNTAVISLRFLYGMRSVGLAVIGAGSMTWSRFIMLDVLAACLWSACWISVGYALGEAVEQLLGTFTPLGRWLFGSLLAAAVVVTSIVYLRRRRAQSAAAAKKV